MASTNITAASTTSAPSSWTSPYDDHWYLVVDSNDRRITARCAAKLANLGLLRAARILHGLD